MSESDWSSLRWGVRFTIRYWRQLSWDSMPRTKGISCLSLYGKKVLGVSQSCWSVGGDRLTLRARVTHGVLILWSQPQSSLSPPVHQTLCRTVEDTGGHWGTLVEVAASTQDRTVSSQFSKLINPLSLSTNKSGDYTSVMICENKKGNLWSSERKWGVVWYELWSNQFFNHTIL